MEAKKLNRNAEDRILAEFVKWAWNAFPAARRAWWHVPNELARLPRETPGNHARRLAQAKAKGVVKGVMDIHGIFGGQFWVIEQKAQGGVLSGDQKKFAETIVGQGAVVKITWSLEETKDTFERMYSTLYQKLEPMTYAWHPLRPSK